MARQQKEAGGIGASGWAGLFVIPARLIGAVRLWRRQTARIPSAAWLLRGMVIAAGFAATIYLLVLVGLASGRAGQDRLFIPRGPANLRCVVSSLVPVLPGCRAPGGIAAAGLG
jgi:hypothetical protein